MTPLYDALKKYTQQNTARFHMPGHKGFLPFPLSDIAKLDFTELDGTGNLYTEESGGAIRQSERKMAKIFGAKNCLYLTGGATQGVFAMLAAVTTPGDTILVDRCSHKSVYHAMAMLGLNPIYINRDIIQPFGISDQLKTLPSSVFDSNPKCLLITSPTYYGIQSDLKSLKKACGNIPLLVDAAHGAHLPFIDNNFESVADIAVYSAHKTVGAIGQAAFLIANDTVASEHLRYLTSVFGTSSPSYPIMVSLDFVQHSHEKRCGWQNVIDFAKYLREKYNSILNVQNIDECRICLYTGDGYRSALQIERELNVVCEMADENNVVFIMTAFDTIEMQTKLETAISKFGKSINTTKIQQSDSLPQSIFSPREAFFSKQKTIKLGQADGEIAAQVIAPYPPGIPLIAPGEKIEKKHIEILCDMCYNEKDTISVIAND